jgi:fructuronate reductase
LTLHDPLVVRLKAIADVAGPDAAQFVPAFLSVHEIFGNDLSDDPRFLHAVTRALTALYKVGARRTVSKFERHFLRIYGRQRGPFLSKFWFATKRADRRAS